MIRATIRIGQMQSATGYGASPLGAMLAAQMAAFYQLDEMSTAHARDLASIISKYGLEDFDREVAFAKGEVMVDLSRLPREYWRMRVEEQAAYWWRQEGKGALP